MAYQYDLAGRRTSMQWPDGFVANYDYDVVGELTAIRENGATTWTLASWTYDNLGRRTAQHRANNATTTWGYDGASRLTSLGHDLSGTANDLTLGFTYNPAGQIATRTMSNMAYAYTPGTGTTAYANNGRNQATSAGGSTVGYDSRQNITTAPTGTYGYNGLNELTSATVGGTATSLSYDPAGRLYQVGTTRFLYDGVQAIGEYDASGNVLWRYVPGLGLDDVAAAYQGSGYTRQWPLQDERQSVVSITDGSAAALATNTYDEYGVPGASNAGRFQYTGQMWLPQAQLYHYRARAYAPALGRFMQTDPVGYGAGMNLYAYVGGDAVNFSDPLGLDRCFAIYRRERDFDAAGNLIGEPRISYSHDMCFGDDVPPGEITEAFGAAGITPVTCSYNSAGRLIGRIWALPNTLVGLGWAGVSWAGGRVLGTGPFWRVGNNALQLFNAPFQSGNRAVTLGNVQVYGRDPMQWSDQTIGSYTGETVNIGLHEEGHTHQSEALGPFYLPAEAFGSTMGNRNPMEVGADRYALGKSCSGF